MSASFVIPAKAGIPLFRHAELDSASILEAALQAEKWTLKQVQGDSGEVDR